MEIYSKSTWLIIIYLERCTMPSADFNYLHFSPLNFRFASNIDGLRRAPNSYYDQRYYSETIMGLNAFDSVERYVRFRLVPADGSLETGLLSKDEQRKAW